MSGSFLDSSSNSDFSSDEFTEIASLLRAHRLSSTSTDFMDSDDSFRESQAQRKRSSSSRASRVSEHSHEMQNIGEETVDDQQNVEDQASRPRTQHERRERQQRRSRHRRRRNQEQPEEEEKLELKYGAQHVIMIFKPVSLTMIIVVATIHSISFFSSRGGIDVIYLPFKEDTDDTATKLAHSIGNGLIFMMVIAGFTVGLVLLYKFRCYKILYGWLIIATLQLTFFLTFFYFGAVCEAYNIPLDFITAIFIIWNYGVVGMLVIHWKGPLLLHQAYLVVNSAILAVVFVRILPDWTTWVLLAVIAAWDLFAVLTPVGPLRILVELAHDRQETLFRSIIYSSTMMWSVTMAGETSEEAHQSASSTHDVPTAEEQLASGDRELGMRLSSNSSPPSTEPSTPAANQEDHDNHDDQEERSGVKLGLGDFIFYSILVGKASTFGDWNTTIACFVAILIGLSLTLFCLAIFKKALPALPISITFGLIFHFATSQIVHPFAEKLAAEQVFI